MLALLVVTLAHPLFVKALEAPSKGLLIAHAYTAADRGSEAKVWAAVQDSNGVLHFGAKGLLNFDGERWNGSPMNESFALRALDYGPDGRLWAGALGELGWFEPGDSKLEFHSLRQFLPPADQEFGEVFRVFAEGNGAVFLTRNKVFRWNGIAFSVWSLSGERKLFGVREGDTIFVQDATNGIHAMRDEGPELVVPATQVGSAGIFWLERNGSRWTIINGNGVFEWANETLRDLAPETSARLHRAIITSVVDLRDGRLAVGTYGAGIFILRRDGSVDRTFGLKDGLPTATLNSLFLDRERRLWATSDSLIFHFNVDSPTTAFGETSGLPAKTINSIQVQSSGIYVATDDGVYVSKSSGAEFAPMGGFVGSARNLTWSADHGLLVSTRRRLVSFTNDLASVAYKSLGDLFVIEAARKHDGHFLISEGHAIKLLAPDGTTSLVASDLPDIATSIAEDEDANLWLGTTSRGVILIAPDGERANDERLRSFGLPAGSGFVTTAATREGDILVLSSHGAWMKPRGAATFEPVADFPERETAALSPIRERAGLWLVLSAAANRPALVGQIAIADGHATWRPHTVEGLDTLGSPQSIFAEPGSAGQTVLWIGGTGRILHHKVAQGPVAPRPQPPLLQVVARREDNFEPIVAPLPYDTKSVVFEFAAPQFSVRPLLRFETRIDGIDNDWVPGGPDSRRELTALRDGSYTFRVRAVAETGVASEPAVFAFEVRPPWWRTAPAILCAVAALIPIGFACYRLRVRTLHRRNAELEAKVRERTDELVAASAAKTQFVANMSHDIRNPLNGIVGLALALEDTRLDGRQREIVATLRECTTYLSSLVDDVLDFASIEAGKVELRPGPFAPQELLRSIVETLRADATESGATLTVEAGPDLPENLLGDAGRIQQILVNFVSNALKYAGGPIQLCVATSPDSPDEVEFAVVDHGPGITAAEQATLFTKFSRLKHTRGGEEIPGTGLGLASCRLLADLMGGSVGVTSEPGSGARFFLRLPLEIATAPIASPVASLPNTTVLLVEDTDYNAWAASAVLAKLGLSCERARTGAEALELFGQKRFNVVLLDRNLPDMDGLEVARRMRQMESDGLQAILLAVTAYCTAEDRAQCLDAGMDAFVGKPLTPEKLRKVLLDAGRRLIATASVQVSPEPPASPEPAVSPELDLALLTYLSDGSAEGLDVQVQRFLASLEESEAQLTSASIAHDFPSLGDNAHRVLGQAKLVGATALAATASRLEAAARAEDDSACPHALQQVRDEIRSLTEAMRPRRPVAQSA